MSYILDSLKKSEQQRKQREQPGLHSEPLGAASRRRQERRVWPYLLLVALLLNAAVLGWYLVGTRGEQGPDEPGKTSVQVDPPREKQQPVLNRDLAPGDPAAVPVSLPTTVAKLQFPEPTALEPPAVEASSKSTPAFIPASGATEPTPYAQLPASVRQELPELVLSLHYFSGSQRSSMIRLDGVILRVGDSVQDGLTVHDIVAEGVVLDYRGRLVWLDRPRG
jgi:general secretion pathway protein B